VVDLQKAVEINHASFFVKFYSSPFFLLQQASKKWASSQLQRAHAVCGLNFNLACKLTGFPKFSLNPHHLRVSCSAINDLRQIEHHLKQLKP
jgi:hypothetical protein